MRDRKPYNPARDGPQTQIHDRRAVDIGRGARGHVVVAEVDDPYGSPGDKIATVRSIRDDPLAWHLARGHIEQHQFEAGRMFQRQFNAAERGPRAVQLLEAVDGDPPRENLTDEQMRAGKWLAKCYVALGKDGSGLIHETLVDNRTTRQIAAARGTAGQAWELYFARRLYEALSTLAVVFGFSNERKPLT